MARNARQFVDERFIAMRNDEALPSIALHCATGQCGPRASPRGGHAKAPERHSCARSCVFHKAPPTKFTELTRMTGSQRNFLETRGEPGIRGIPKDIADYFSLHCLLSCGIA
eukprot:1756084-Pyramimonas_sp.AAC.1